MGEVTAEGRRHQETGSRIINIMDIGESFYTSTGVYWLTLYHLVSLVCCVRGSKLILLPI